MTNFGKLRLDNMYTVAYWSELGGVEVKEIRYDKWEGEEYALIVAGTFAGKRSYHKVKIQYMKNDWFILLFGKRLHGKDCIRTNLLGGKKNDVL